MLPPRINEVELSISDNLLLKPIVGAITAQHTLEAALVDPKLDNRLSICSPIDAFELNQISGVSLCLVRLVPKLPLGCVHSEPKFDVERKETSQGTRRNAQRHPQFSVK